MDVRSDNEAGLVALAPVGVDRDLNKVLVVLAEDQRDDGLGLGRIVFRIGGKHLIADLDIFDGLACAIRHEYVGAGYEALAANATTVPV
ncbi:hypothetical protein HNP84_006983 [Thermocatellispora tengchongensis]|uniref:Uncharacterized protein n=1 Tax=Thermocatellispora tengchongensis TaxID=1073253 RepID=A0A840PHD2_9ACTN|nr:hypothetical protein [Thermocatellispora tengchongensis]MBB5137231.1 hypothetical protein [Thermocatellispora tengchongensis]